MLDSGNYSIITYLIAEIARRFSATKEGAGYGFVLAISVRFLNDSNEV